MNKPHRAAMHSSSVTAWSEFRAKQTDNYLQFKQGYCSTFHTAQYLGLECLSSGLGPVRNVFPAVALGLTSILSSEGMVS